MTSKVSPASKYSMSVLDELKTGITDLVEQYKESQIPMQETSSVARVCFVVEKILHMGLKDIAIFGTTTVWDYLIEVKESLPGGDKLIDKIKHLQKTDIGRTRAFIRVGLNDQSLGHMLEALVWNRDLTAKYYEREALLNSEEYASMLFLLLENVKSLPFNLRVDDPLLGHLHYWDLMARSATPTAPKKPNVTKSVTTASANVETSASMAAGSATQTRKDTHVQSKSIQATPQIVPLSEPSLTSTPKAPNTPMEQESMQASNADASVSVQNRSFSKPPVASSASSDNAAHNPTVTAPIQQQHPAPNAIASSPLEPMIFEQAGVSIQHRPTDNPSPDFVQDPGEINPSIIIHDSTPNNSQRYQLLRPDSPTAVPRVNSNPSLLGASPQESYDDLPMKLRPYEPTPNPLSVSPITTAPQRPSIGQSPAPHLLEDMERGMMRDPFEGAMYGADSPRPGAITPPNYGRVLYTPPGSGRIPPTPPTILTRPSTGSIAAESKIMLLGNAGDILGTTPSQADLPQLFSALQQQQDVQLPHKQLLLILKEAIQRLREQNFNSKELLTLHSPVAGEILDSIEAILLDAFSHNSSWDMRYAALWGWLSSVSPSTPHVTSILSPLAQLAQLSHVSHVSRCRAFLDASINRKCLDSILSSLAREARWNPAPRCLLINDTLSGIFFKLIQELKQFHFELSENPLDPVLASKPSPPPILASSNPESMSTVVVTSALTMPIQTIPNAESTRAQSEHQSLTTKRDNQVTGDDDMDNRGSKLSPNSSPNIIPDQSLDFPDEEEDASSPVHAQAGNAASGTEKPPSFKKRRRVVTIQDAPPTPPPKVSEQNQADTAVSPPAPSPLFAASVDTSMINTTSSAPQQSLPEAAITTPPKALDNTNNHMNNTNIYVTSSFAAAIVPQNAAPASSSSLLSSETAFTHTTTYNTSRPDEIGDWRTPGAANIDITGRTFRPSSYGRDSLSRSPKGSASMKLYPMTSRPNETLMEGSPSSAIVSRSPAIIPGSVFTAAMSAKIPIPSTSPQSISPTFAFSPQLAESSVPLSSHSPEIDDHPVRRNRSFSGNAPSWARQIQQFPSIGSYKPNTEWLGADDDDDDDDLLSTVSPNPTRTLPLGSSPSSVPSSPLPYKMLNANVIAEYQPTAKRSIIPPDGSRARRTITSSAESDEENAPDFVHVRPLEGEEALELDSQLYRNSRPADFFILELVTKPEMTSKNSNCSGCGDDLTPSTARWCAYSSNFYCTNCHSNKKSIIPARVIKRWNFKPGKVSDYAYDYLCTNWNRPVLDVNNLDREQIERHTSSSPLSLPIKLPLLPRVRSSPLVVISELTAMRERLMSAAEFIRACRSGERLLGTLRDRLHLLWSSTLWSMQDLVDAKAGKLEPILKEAIQLYSAHVRNCDSCSGKGFVCEICTAREVIYPFDPHTTSCPNCKALFHDSCWRSNPGKCPKCVRVRSIRGKEKPF